MISENILIVYPQDETTDFLQEIPAFLFERYEKAKFIYRRLGFKEEEHIECIKLIEGLTPNSFIIFLGHGRSDALLGAFNYERFDFVNNTNLHVFKNKKVFFLSCRSSELLYKQEIEGIGFGHLLSSSNELNDSELRRNYWYLFSKYGIPDTIAISQFNDLIVSIIKNSLLEYISQKLTLRVLHLKIKLRLRKSIAQLIIENNPSDVRNLINLFLKAKDEMKLF